MSRRLLWPLLIVVSIAVALFFWGHRAETPVTTAPLAPLESSVPPAATPAAAVPAAKSAAPSADFSIDARNQEIVRGCLARANDLPRVNFTERMKLEEVLQDLSGGAEGDVSTEQINIHVRHPDGREQRLHVQPYDSDMKASPRRWKIGASDVRVYDVDAEGLPVATAYPSEMKTTSLKETISTFTSGGRVTFRERRLHEKFGDRLAADLVETDGHLTELQVTGGGVSFGCAWQNAQLDCRCL